MRSQGAEVITDPDNVRDNARLQGWLTAAALVAAAGLVGFGLVLWVAANWDDLGKWGRFGLVAGAIAVSAIASAGWRPARAGGALCGVLGIGGLLALTGQTYQTGADPWQLFALWAALALPWALAARHDAVWSLWVAVAFTALPLWVVSLTGRYQHDLPTLAIEWLAALAICAALSGNIGLERWIGRTKWAFRLAVVLTLAIISGTGLEALFGHSGVRPAYFAALLSVALVVAGLAAVRTPLDLPLLAAATLALDVLLISGLARAIVFGHESVGDMLSLGLLSAGIVAASAVALLHITKARQPGGKSPVSAMTTATDAAPVAVSPPAEPARTWPVAVLSGIGAVMAGMPLLSFLFMLFGRVLERGAGTWIAGLVVLAGTIPWLRKAKPFGFGQQLGVISLAVGGLLMGFASYRDLPIAFASLVMTLLVTGLAFAVPIAWVRGLLGAAATGFVTVLIAQTLDNVRHMPDVAAFRLAWTLITAAAAGALLYVPRVREDMSAFALGWSAAALLGLMLAAGETFLVGARLGMGGPTLGTAVGHAGIWSVTRVLCVGAALASAWLLLDRIRSLHSPSGYCVIATGVILSAFMPSLGPALLVLAAAYVTERRTIAVLAAVACLWIIGSFYYWLGWPLVQKAYLLIGLGLALGLACWISGLRAPEIHTSAPPSPALSPALAAGLIGLSALATAALVGNGVRGMEHILSNGRVVQIPLTPVDPRSLMQGDYMALRFALPSTPAALEMEKARTPAMYAVARLDTRGAATITELSAAKPASLQDQMGIALAWRWGRWSLGTDAFYFKEGTAERYAKARFGSFRVDESGRALLTGLASEDLQPLQ